MAKKKVAVVIHDKANTNETIQRILAERGFVTHPAKDVMEGRRLIAKHQPDVVVADWQVGERGGEELEVKFDVPARKREFDGIKDPIAKREWLVRHSHAGHVKVSIPDSLGLLNEYLSSNPRAIAVIVSVEPPAADKASIRKLEPGVRKRITSCHTGDIVPVLVPKIERTSRAEIERRIGRKVRKVRWPRRERIAKAITAKPGRRRF